MSSRRARRRLERERAKRTGPSRPVPPLQRVLLLTLGLAMVIGGVALVAAAGTGSAQRLGRVAGILIVIGIVVVAVGMLGRR